MRVGLIYFAPRQIEKARPIARQLTSALQGQGHQVDTFDIADQQDIRLTMYEYIVVLGETINSWSGKIHPALSRFLLQSPTVHGKRTTALLLPPILWKGRALLNLMKVLEAEGMRVNFSALAVDEKQTKSLALTLPITDA